MEITASRTPVNTTGTRRGAKLPVQTRTDMPTMTDPRHLPCPIPSTGTLSLNFALRKIPPLYGAIS